MTLASAPSYDPDRIDRRGERAIVVGGGVAGLLATRVLADAFDRVTVIERDRLPDDPRGRPGVPQSTHVHALLEAGRAVFEDLFPGYGAEVRAAGGLLIDAARELRYHHHGRYLARGPEPLPMLCASRPLLEHVLRERLTERDDVHVRAPCTFTGFLLDSNRHAVSGVRVREGSDHRELHGAITVDATGRASPTPRWLESEGFDVPPREDVYIDLAYSSLVVERPADARGGFLIAPAPPAKRGGTVVPVEDGRWMVTLFGVHGDHPPGDHAGCEEFAARLPAADPARILTEHSVLGEDVHRYQFPSNRRYRYERVEGLPDGLLVIGDAIASFNPIYGQGMSVAALEALHLHQTLDRSPVGPLAPAFFDRVAGTVDLVWRMTVGADFGFPETTGPAPSGTAIRGWYLDRLIRTAHEDGLATDAFARVLRLEHPPRRLLRPSILRRVLSPL